MSHAFLYCMEGGLRATIKASWLLLLHHTLFFVLLASGLWVGPSMLMVEVGCYERVRMVTAVMHQQIRPEVPASACTFQGQLRITELGGGPGFKCAMRAACCLQPPSFRKCVWCAHAVGRKAVAPTPSNPPC
jgi:hypothetical protein